MNTHIYVNNDVSQWHSRKLPNCITSNDLNHFLATTTETKAALLQIPYPLESKKFSGLLNKLIEPCELTVILITELHRDTVDFYRHHQHPKIKYFLCGSTVYQPEAVWMDWFATSSSFYKSNTKLLDTLTPYEVKPRFFDALLGRKKPHRDLIYQFVNENCADQTIMTYLEGLDAIPLEQQNHTGWLWEDTGLELLTNSTQWTVTPVKYYGQGMSLSQVIPLKVYNQTAYSIVAETNFDNDYSFYTEKIVKPILAERLFLVFSGQHYLKNLRSLGFKTFDGIIDESYDLILNPQQRFAEIFKQMQWLIAQPQEHILKQIQPITMHNKKVMLENNWQGEFTSNLRNLFASIQPD